MLAGRVGRGRQPEGWRARAGHGRSGATSLIFSRLAPAFARLQFLLLLVAAGASGQELNPRAYAPMPTGGNIVMLAYGGSWGGVMFDPTLPVEDVHATIHSAVILYGHSFGLFGRSANAFVGLPYAWGEMDGLLQGEYTRITRSGLADFRGQLSVNVFGGPALSPREFASQRPRTIVGVSLAVAAPTGQYDPAKLINIGANRWSLKPEVGVSRTEGRWYLELYGGVWIFGTNRDYAGGSVREQQPLGTFQAHVSYTLKPRLWLAADATYYSGGRTTVDQKTRADLQANSRLGITLAVPVGRRSNLKVSWATGFTTRIGGDFDTVGIAFQTVWFGRP